MRTTSAGVRALEQNQSRIKKAFDSITIGVSTFPLRSVLKRAYRLPEVQVCGRSISVVKSRQVNGTQYWYSRLLFGSSRRDGRVFRTG